MPLRGDVAKNATLPEDVGPLQDVAVAVRGGDRVLGLRDHTDGQPATLDLHVGNVDEVGTLRGVRQVSSGELALQEEDHRLPREELELSDLVAVARFHVALDAVPDRREHRVGVDLDQSVTEDAVDGPASVVKPSAPGIEEGNRVTLDGEVQTFEFTGGHFGITFHTRSVFACLLPK